MRKIDLSPSLSVITSKIVTDKWTGRDNPISWPPASPDLTSFNFYRQMLSIFLYTRRH